MSSAAADQRAKPLAMRKRPVLVLMVMLLALTGVALFYLTKRTGAHGILVHWHLRQLHFGPFYVREITLDPNGNYVAVGRGYSIGFCDIFRVTREPPAPELRNATLLVEEKGAGTLVGSDSGADIWREVASGLGAGSVTNTSSLK